MKRILSGIKPTGDVHLGSYLGAMKHWPAYQAAEQEVFFFLADLHALNTRLAPTLLRSNSLDLVAWLLALGVDPGRSPIYAQSQVPAHSELCWILNNYTTMGELSRMTQYKDKAQKAGPEGQLVGLFDYPVLMAADILLYSADEIPVGDDQAQHVELTRDIAERVNNLYGQVLRLPSFVAPPVAARVMMLDAPTQKMSKSESGDGCVYLLDSPDQIRKKFSRAVTDSVGKVGHDRLSQPGVTNLIEIYAAIKEVTLEEALLELEAVSYADLKSRVAEAVVREIEPLQEKFRSVRADEAGLYEVLRAGQQRASAVAEDKLSQVKQAIGLL